MHSINPKNSTSLKSKLIELKLQISTWFSKMACNDAKEHYPVKLAILTNKQVFLLISSFRSDLHIFYAFIKHLEKHHWRNMNKWYSTLIATMSICVVKICWFVWDIFNKIVLSSVSYKNHVENISFLAMLSHLFVQILSLLCSVQQ